MNKPLVSIIMLVYNNVQYLKYAVDSVLEQTYQNWELLLNDDSSTDGAWELAQELAKLDSRIKPVQRPAFEKPKTGWAIASNRLSALNRSTGDLICHLDGDDALYPHSLEYMVKHFNKHPDDGIANSDFAWIDKNNFVFQYHQTKEAGDKLHEYSWRHFGMYRREAYNKTKGLNLELNGICEDADLFMQIAEKNKFNRVPHVLYRYRNHDTNTVKINKITCDKCPNRAKCNYIRVWGDSMGYDYINWKWPDKNNQEQ